MLLPGIDVRIFDDPQLIMDHGPVPALPVCREMTDNGLEQRSVKAFVAVDGTQLGPLFVWLVLDLEAFRRDTFIEHLLGRPH